MTESEEPTEDFAAAVEDASGQLLGRRGTRFDRVLDAGLLLSGLLIAAVAVAVSFNVISRQFFGRTYTWVFEYSEFAMLVLVFLAVAGVARSDGHVRMEIADELLSPEQLRPLMVATDILGAAIALLLALIGTWMTYRNFIAETTIGLLNTPRWLVLSVVPVGSTALFFGQARMVIRRLRGVKPTAV